MAESRISYHIIGAHDAWHISRRRATNDETRIGRRKVLTKNEVVRLDFVNLKFGCAATFVVRSLVKSRRLKKFGEVD